MKLSLRTIVLLVIVFSVYLMSKSLAGASGLSGGSMEYSRDTTSGWEHLPFDANDHFMTSGNCDGCHGYDPTGYASVDGEGNDISPVTTWRAGMMANSGRDPFFRAKMSHESAVNPQHQAELEDKCTSCHAPLGRYSYHLYGYGPYGLSDLEHDRMGQDGVSCMACHKQTDQFLGSNHSGELHFAEEMIEYGPFEKPLQAPMQGFVGVSPEYSPHITDAGVCAGCHSLLTSSVDLQGNFTGTTFVEQATYHEWLNSDYSAEVGGTTCQGCHIPRVTDQVVIAANYQVLQPRSPFGKHELVGGNSFMLKLMKENRVELDIRANEVHFDSTIARTLRNLQQLSLSAVLEFDGAGNDTAFFSLKLRNLTGHKFPSGYPSRRAFVEFVVTNQYSDTIFSSGLMDNDYNIVGENATHEPHFNVISSSDQVQIYEMVMGDVNGNVTTVLERAYSPLKDNRLAPRGFTATHPVYDTTAIAGNALADTDFNFDGFEGSGTDVIHFHVPVSGEHDTLSASAKVYYQSVPKKWLQEMFATNTPQITAFESMFNTADHTPVLVASDLVSGIPVSLSVAKQDLNNISIYPNPSKGLVYLKGINSKEVKRIQVYATNGDLVQSFTSYPTAGIQLPSESGVYLILLQIDGKREILRVVRD
ncbi:MAG: T9SS type A sorting domain-containing protein [Flavobacteriales bacterium]|nr:T9SS type A sorting domain-containing protein [Flavobacteriales bacterium]